MLTHRRLATSLQIVLPQIDTPLVIEFTHPWNGAALFIGATVYTYVGDNSHDPANETSTRVLSEVSSDVHIWVNTVS